MVENRFGGWRKYLAIPTLLYALGCGGDKGSLPTGNTVDDNNGNVVKPIEKFSDGVPGQLILAEFPDGRQTLELILNGASAEKGDFLPPPIKTSTIDRGNEFDYTKDGKNNKDDVPIFLATKPTSQKAREFTNNFGYYEADGLDGRLDSGMNAKGEVFVRLNPDYGKLNGATSIDVEVKKPANNLMSYKPNDVVDVPNEGATLRFVDESLMGQETDAVYTARNDGRWKVRGNAKGRVAMTYFNDVLPSDLIVRFNNEGKDKVFAYVKVRGDIHQYQYVENEKNTGGIGEGATPYHTDGTSNIFRHDITDDIVKGNNTLQFRDILGNGKIEKVIISNYDNLKL